MPAVVALYARCFLIGIAVAAPVGACGTLCINRTLRGGWRDGMLTGLGVASADATFAAVAAFGITAVSSLLQAWTVPLRIAGGLVLVLLGVRAFRSRPRLEDAADPPSAIGLYASAAALTFTNPTTILEFGVIFASAGLIVTHGDVLLALAATLGVASGSLAWWLVLTTVLATGRRRIGDRALGLVNAVSGVALAAFGLVVLASLLVR
jgi:putative LysE/RhtB family amino acid efflux pump